VANYSCSIVAAAFGFSLLIEFILRRSDTASSSTLYKTSSSGFIDTIDPFLSSGGRMLLLYLLEDFGGSGSGISFAVLDFIN